MKTTKIIFSLLFFVLLNKKYKYNNYSILLEYKDI